MDVASLRLFSVIRLGPRIAERTEKSSYRRWGLKGETREAGEIRHLHPVSNFNTLTLIVAIATWVVPRVSIYPLMSAQEYSAIVFKTLDLLLGHEAIIIGSCICPEVQGEGK